MRRPSQVEREELHAPSILLGASGMGLLRGIVGFLAFLLAFNLQGHHRPVWELGVAVAASVLGSLVGAVVAPKLRKVAVEERLLIGALVMTFFVALASATVLDGLTAAALLAFTVGLCASGGKLAFDSIVQRDAPDREPGALVRPLRDPLPAAVGGGRRDRGHRHAGQGGLRRHRGGGGVRRLRLRRGPARRAPAQRPQPHRGHRCRRRDRGGA